MSPKDVFSGVKIFDSLTPQTLSSATVTNGTAVDLSINNPQSLVVFTNLYNFTSGAIQVQDVQYDTVNTFDSPNLTTITDVEKFQRNDRYSSADALAQTELTAVGIAKIGVPNFAVGGQRFFRVRYVTTGTVNLDVYSFVAIEDGITGLLVQ